MREGRSPQQIGWKGLSNHRWIVGGKLCLVLNQWGLIVGWACATANVADQTFQWLIRQFEERMIVLSDTGFHAAEGDPANLKLCQRGEWQDRMLVETVLSMLTLVCHFKQVMHRGWAYFQARLTLGTYHARSGWRTVCSWRLHPLASKGLTALRVHERASTIARLHKANTVAWGLLRWGRCCMRVVSHGSKPAWQTMASLLAVVGHCIPHTMPSGGKSITYFSKNLPL